MFRFVQLFGGVIHKQLPTRTKTYTLMCVYALLDVLQLFMHAYIINGY